MVVSSSRSLSPRCSKQPAVQAERPRSPSEPPKPNHAQSRDESVARPPPSRPRNPSIAHSDFSAHSIAESLVSLPPMPETPQRGGDVVQQGSRQPRVVNMHGRSRSSDRKLQDTAAGELRSVVVYLNGVRKRYDDQALKREVDRVFPGIDCRASCLSNGGVLFKYFKCREDVDTVASLKWEEKIGGLLPFGGVDNAKVSRLPSKDVAMRTARLVVHKDSRGEWVRERLLEEEWGDCVVTEVGDPFNGLRTLRIVLPTHDLLHDFVTKGFRLGSERLSPVPWRMHQAARLCNTCWRRHEHNGKCHAKRRCRICGGDCRRNECRARKAKCPNCCLPHAATNVFCSYKQALMRKFATKTCLPLPLFVESVPKANRQPPDPINVEHPARRNGRLYANVSDHNRAPNGVSLRAQVRAPQAIPIPNHVAGPPHAQSGENQVPQAPNVNMNSFHRFLEETLSKVLAPIKKSISALTAKVDSLEQRFRAMPNPERPLCADHEATDPPRNAERRSSDPTADVSSRRQPQQRAATTVSPDRFFDSLQRALAPVLQSLTLLSTSMSRMEKSGNDG